MSNYTIQDLKDNLDYLEETKNQIKQALINKGASISDSDTFRSYVDKINNLDVFSNSTSIWYLNTSETNISVSSNQALFNTTMQSFEITINKTNCSAANYNASQQSTLKTDDLVFINYLHSSSDNTNIVCFGKINSLISLQDSYNINVNIYGGYIV